MASFTENQLANSSFILAGTSDSEYITIPADATAEGLIAEIKREFEEAGIPFTIFEEKLVEVMRRDLELVRGMTLQYSIFKSNPHWTLLEGRQFQESQGYNGNAAAFLVWVMKTKLRGWFLCIPNDGDLFPLNFTSFLGAQQFYRDSFRRDYFLCDNRCEWPGISQLIAFRAV
jgi:hypothetical protein